MAFTSPRFPLSSIFPSHSSSLKISTKLYPNSLLKLQENSILLSSSSGSQFSPLTSEQALLEAIVESDAKLLPAVRTYENDLARLTIVGSVDFQQALAAAAADGGVAADEHISSGTAAMVVETVFSGPFDEHSTISTRLFLPTRKVKEKAIKFKKSMTKDIFTSTTSKNILAMTFRQVVLQQLWNFELEIFSPERDRDMTNLENSKEVSLADMFDMYYEDVFTLPGERLSCSAVATPSNLALNKGSSMLKMFSVALASGIFLVAISVVAKINLPHLPSRKREILNGSTPQSIDVDSVPYHSVESFKVESCCVEIISRVKNYFGWPGKVNWMNHGHYAWIGKLPSHLSVMDDVESNIIGTPSISKSEEAGSEDMNALQDIASYQVVLSPKGNIIGFQPTNRVAVNNWAANPIAKELYGGKSLSPGIFEPGLQINYPNDVLVLKLLMSTNPELYFALVRADDSSGNIKH